MKHILYKSLLVLLFFTGSQVVMATTDVQTKKTALDYLLECPECKDVSELLQEEATRGCCNSCNNCSSCNTCSNCCKKGESDIKRSSCCNKCNNCTSCKTCSSCCKKGDSNINRSSCCNKCNNCTSCKTCSNCCKSINFDDCEDTFDEQTDDLEVNEVQNFAVVQELLETLQEQIEELQLYALTNRKKVVKKSFPEANSRSLRK